MQQSLGPALVMACVLGLPLTVAGQGEPKWEAMDYGPFLSASIEVEPGNIACKGIAVPLGETPEGEATMLFDIDLLRWAAGWRGDGVALRGIVYDGPHGIHPKIDGTPDWVTSTKPGISVDGEFADLRPWRYGPLDSRHVRWGGVQLHGEEVAVSYRVGSTEILETPGLIVETDLPVYTRTIQVDGDDQDLLIELLKAPRNSARLMDASEFKLKAPGIVGDDRFGVVIMKGNRPVTAIGIVQPGVRDARVVQQDADVRLLLHPGKYQGPEVYQVLMAPIRDREELDTFAKVLTKLNSSMQMTRFAAPMQDVWIPTVEIEGDPDFNPSRADDSRPLHLQANMPARDIALAAANGTTMKVVGFDGKDMTGADIPIRDTYVWSTVEGQPMSIRPAGSWTFDEGEGSEMRNDATGQKDLVLEGVTWRRGIMGRCLDFDGTARAIWSGSRRMPFTQSDLTFSAWIATRSDGTIMSKTLPEGPWVPDGVTFFVRDGSLAFDVGWVGVVHGSTAIDDGAWHHVAFTWTHEDGRIRLFVNGQEEVTGTLPVGSEVEGAVVQLGFTAEDFPNPTRFSGYMEGVRVYNRALDVAQLQQVAAQTGSPLVQAWLVQGVLPGATWRRLGSGDVVLHLSSEPVPQAAELVTWRGPDTSLAEALDRMRGIELPSQSAFTIDQITRPEENPWNSWMRFGAMDFMPTGDAAVITTWSGDVWLVQNLDEDLQSLEWTRIAAGLNQPLGISVRDGEIYVLGRDQMTHLQDLNDDWVTDHYVSFNNDTMNSEHFHEPVSGLQRDAAGNFYYLKAARHAKDAIHPHHGTLVRVTADGSSSEILASGFRAPNGLAVEPDGVFFCSDQEGHWMPANRINRITTGGFYGNNWTGTPMEDRDTYDLPLAWIHPTVDRSPSSQLRVTNPDWGDLNGRLLGLSYGTGRVYLILEDEVDGVHQGGVVPLPIQVPTGLMSGRFNPADGHLYLCGLVGWSSDAKEDGGFYRVRSTGSLPLMPIESRAVKDGLVLHFTEPLDGSATEPQRWDVNAWNYQWTERYGSPQFKLDGEEGRTELPVKRVVLSPDRRTAWLVIPKMSPAMQMHVEYLVPADGRDHEGYAHLTVHRLASESGRHHVTK